MGLRESEQDLACLIRRHRREDRMRSHRRTQTCKELRSSIQHHRIRFRNDSKLRSLTLAKPLVLDFIQCKRIDLRLPKPPSLLPADRLPQPLDLLPPKHLKTRLAALS